jgi:hypothetical protein
MMTMRVGTLWRKKKGTQSSFEREAFDEANHKTQGLVRTERTLSEDLETI